MARISYEKRTCAKNKDVVLDSIYSSLAEYANFSSIIMLSGKYPEHCVKRAIKYFSNMTRIVLYESDYPTYKYVSQSVIDKIRSDILKGRKFINIHNKNVLYADKLHSFQDLDFCSTFFAEKSRGWDNIKQQHDPITIFQDRLFYQRRMRFPKWKAMVGTVSPRNGLGKDHTISCIDSLCQLLGCTIVSVDGYSRTDTWSEAYGKGKKLKDSGTLHGNGGYYYAYKHSVEVEFHHPSPLDAVKEIIVELYTYTDTQPMVTFSILYKT